MAGLLQFFISIAVASHCTVDTRGSDVVYKINNKYVHAHYKEHAETQIVSYLKQPVLELSGLRVFLKHPEVVHSLKIYKEQLQALTKLDEKNKFAWFGLEGLYPSAELNFITRLPLEEEKFNSIEGLSKQEKQDLLLLSLSPTLYYLYVNKKTELLVGLEERGTYTEAVGFFKNFYSLNPFLYTEYKDHPATLEIIKKIINTTSYEIIRGQVTADNIEERLLQEQELDTALRLKLVTVMEPLLMIKENMKLRDIEVTKNIVTNVHKKGSGFFYFGSAHQSEQVDQFKKQVCHSI